MKKLLFVLLALLALVARPSHAARPKTRFFAADDPRIQYTGRVDFSNAKKPRFWAPGVYLTLRFRGTGCAVQLTNEGRYGNNYVEVVLDGQPSRLKLTGRDTLLTVAHDLPDTEHLLVLCKDTEANQGYLEMGGLRCARLLPPPPRPTRRLECVGNSITCGMGADQSAVACGQGQWYDQHNAYMAYGPRTARALGAAWQLSSESGIGLIHSCCDKKNLMPQEFGSTDLQVGGQPWDFARYQPDVVTVCLGQNDGVQDSVAFCGTYVQFLHTLRAAYPRARLVCLTSPMADAQLTAVLQRYLTGVVAATRAAGDANVDKYFFSHSFNGGCSSHPSLAEHELIAAELTAYLKQAMGW